MVKVFGHKAPDTDCVCASIAYAWYLKNVKNSEAESFILSEPNREALYVLERFQVEMPKLLGDLTSEDTVAIVDTNNPEELPENINDATILEIVDHHKLIGGLMTSNPLTITMMPIASTSSIIWKKMKDEGITNVDSKILSLLLAAILSDTLNFTSPTTTDLDKEFALELAELTSLDIEELSHAMFEAKSNLEGLSPKDILLADSKVFDVNGKKVRVSVLETTKPENALNMKADLIKGMGEIKANDGLSYMFFYVVDILKSASTLITETEEEKAIAGKAYDTSFTGETLYLEGIVSRKKQMIPNIEKALK